RGIVSGAGNRIQGNYIGTDVSGTRALPNADGILAGAGNLIGGTQPGARNLISGNRSSGITINGPSGNRIEGNYIGTDITGLLAVPNYVGVEIAASEDNTIGGTATGAGNLISGNTGPGISLFDNFQNGSNRVQGNTI